jgi:dimethylaniline monooxygenase (N-oxide forming)
MAFSDFPMPEHYPHYARHDQVFDYFRDYVDHFGFGHTITFNTEVTDVRRGGRGGWDVDITIRNRSGRCPRPGTTTP